MMPDRFELVSDFTPQGDQPQAIRGITQHLEVGSRFQTLLGVTGSGKTFTMAHVAERMNRPVLVLSHNKTLAAQLYRELKDLFPHNAVEFFVSYYDYYQPEAYIPNRDLYIEKDASINEELDRVRLSATQSLLERRDVIVVSSVSCIYGIASPKEYFDMRVPLEVGQEINRDDLLRRLVEIQYLRNDLDFTRGVFRVRGDTVDIFRAQDEKVAIRIELFGDEIEAIRQIDPLRGTHIGSLKKISIYPAVAYVQPPEKMQKALKSIRAELADRLDDLERENKLVEAQRLEQKTRFDLEMLEEMGHCTGIENYSRHLENRAPGEPPFTLLDYFPKDFLLFIDESHATIPQVRAMYNGDQSRKINLVEHGFRLPSALDNRPLNFEEFLRRLNQTLFVSATPGEWEIDHSEGRIVEQIVRPTGLLEPVVEVRPATEQVDDLLGEIRDRVEKKERVLVTTLTKRMAEDLTEYFNEMGVKVRYLHSDIDTIERTEIIHDLRAGIFDCLVGVNLLREGLDLPEVSLVAILDADKEGFLRDARSLTQTCGRAARNVNGRVILYADKMTGSMTEVLEEIQRRREKQEAFNQKHNITPQTVRKNVATILDTVTRKEDKETKGLRLAEKQGAAYHTQRDLEKTIADMKAEMQEAARKLEFERAAELRDAVLELENKLVRS